MQALRAPVRPRFVSASSGDALTLEDSVLEAYKHFKHGVIEITGPAGAGKTSALQHLAAVLPETLGVEFLHRREVESNAAELTAVVEVDLGSAPLPGRIARFQLAPWGEDELIEYALAQFPENGSSVLKRTLAASDRQLLNGHPELCALTLDRFADDQELATVRDAILAEVNQLTNLDKTCLPTAQRLWSESELLTHDRLSRELPHSLRRLLNYVPVRIVVAAQEFAGEINARNTKPLHVVCQRGRQLNVRTYLVDALIPSINEKGVEFLTMMIERSLTNDIQPVIAMILFRMIDSWRPKPRCRPNLCQADLSNAQWEGIDLRRYELRGSDLSSCDLNNSLFIATHAAATSFCNSTFRNANLRKIKAEATDFQGCDFWRVRAANGHFRLASFRNVNAPESSFANADLTEVDLSKGCFQAATFQDACLNLALLDETDFSEANFTRARLRNVDLRTARLDGANFFAADLEGSDLESVSLNGARFSRANLRSVNLTAASMPESDFKGTRFRNAYLAEVDFSRSDLRGAVFTGALFHMGSSRSGLINSPLASEGSRTGFYAEDYDDHLFRCPEDIRTADLRGCDLRRATIKGVDFWRVDLRGAIFDEEQRDQFIATGAILD